MKIFNGKFIRNLRIAILQIIESAFNCFFINIGQIPPSGETIIFELHQQNNTHLIWDESSFIKVLLLNETNVDLSIDKLYLLKLPACNNTDFCSVRQFFTSVSDLILTPDEWIKECQIVPAKEFYFELLGLISIIVIILLFILILKKKRRF